MTTDAVKFVLLKCEILLLGLGEVLITLTIKSQTGDIHQVKTNNLWHICAVIRDWWIWVGARTNKPQLKKWERFRIRIQKYFCMRPTEFQSDFIWKYHNSCASFSHHRPITRELTCCPNINSQRQTHLFNGMSIFSPAVQWNHILDPPAPLTV